MSAGDEWSGSHAEWEGEKLYTGKSKLLANDENHLTSSLDDKNQIEDTVKHYMVVKPECWQTTKVT